MWWSRIALLLLLSACGFAPAYAPGSTASALRAQTSVSAPDTVEGYRLLQALRDRLGDADSPAYDLTVGLTITPVAAAAAANGNATRFSLPGIATYVLRSGDGVTLAQGQVSGFTSYSATGTTVATAAAEQDARARLAVLLADQIMVRLAAAELPQ